MNNRIKLSTYLNLDKSDDEALYNAIKNDKNLLGSESSKIKNILFKHYFTEIENSKEPIKNDTIKPKEKDNPKKKLFNEICNGM